MSAVLEREPHTYYPPEQKAHVLALLDANNGNVLRTAEQTGINRSTIQYWIANESRYANLQQQKVIDLAAKAELNANLLADSIHSHDLDSASLSQKATAFGIMVDKMQLLRGQPTSITETVEKHDLTVILQSALSDAIDVTPTSHEG